MVWEDECWKWKGSLSHEAEAVPSKATWLLAGDTGAVAEPAWLDCIKEGQRNPRHLF